MDSTAEGRGRNENNHHRRASDFVDSLPQEDISGDVTSSAILGSEGTSNESRAKATHSELRKKKMKVRENNPAFRTKEESSARQKALVSDASPLLPRETGHDIGLGSPVPLSLEAVGIITRMRNQKVSHLDSTLI